MFQKTIKWYRGLGWWKWIAWVIVAVVAAGSFLVFVWPWILSAKYRAMARTVKADAAVGGARHDIEAGKVKIGALIDERDRAVQNAANKGKEADALRGDIERIDGEISERQRKVKGQTDDEKVGFFNKRYPR